MSLIREIAIAVLPKPLIRLIERRPRACLAFAYVGLTSLLVAAAIQDGRPQAFLVVGVMLILLGAGGVR